MSVILSDLLHLVEDMQGGGLDARLDVPPRLQSEFIGRCPRYERDYLTLAAKYRHDTRFALESDRHPHHRPGRDDTVDHAAPVITHARTGWLLRSLTHMKRHVFGPDRDGHLVPHRGLGDCLDQDSSIRA